VSHTPGEMKVAVGRSGGLDLCANYTEYDECNCCGEEDQCECGCERTLSRSCTVVAVVPSPTNSGTIPDEDAARLAHCWNNHDGMLAALKRNIEDHQCAQESNGPHENCPCWYCESCRVIAKAEATP
jgi:hypothetical protein